MELDLDGENIACLGGVWGMGMGGAGVSHREGFSMGLCLPFFLVRLLERVGLVTVVWDIGGGR